MKKLIPAMLIASTLLAQDRPKILGLAAMAVNVKDLAKSRQFYEQLLGFAEPFSVPGRSGDIPRIVYVKVNDQQYFELYNESDRSGIQLHHISFQIDNAAQMYAYFKAQGVKIIHDGGAVAQDAAGNATLSVRDPDGHIVEFVEYRPDGWTSREAGQFMPATAASTHLRAVGIIIADLDKAMAFYNGILGFKETWRSGKSPASPDYVHFNVPDGQDYVEFEFTNKAPGPGGRGSKNHASLVTFDADKTQAQLSERAAQVGYQRPIAIKGGGDRRRALNVYDPDSTRIEFREPDAVTSQPVTAPETHSAQR